jgi:hypothetical protein
MLSPAKIPEIAKSFWSLFPENAKSFHHPKHKKGDFIEKSPFLLNWDFFPSTLRGR